MFNFLLLIFQEDEEMLLSIALIMLVGMAAAMLSKKVGLPGLVGMILTGAILGPCVLNLIDDSILNISSELRKIALIIILTRAGLTLDLDDLKRAGRPALLMCFLPASFEILGMILVAPHLLHISILEVAIMGAVIAAVSPAVVVPKMIQLMEEGYGMNKQIPQIILAGASVDDVFVIVLFTSFTGLAQGDQISVMKFVNIPISIIAGILIGAVIGIALGIFFTKVHMRDTIKVIIILSLAFILVSLEEMITIPVTFAALISVMFMGIFLKRKKADTSARLSAKFNKLWVMAEIILFVLVGASVDITFISKAGLKTVILIFAVLVFRMAGVFICMLGTKLNGKERLFCMLAYTPKATVQAAIGGVPLAMGLACGNIVLTVAVIAIVITAPLGAFMIEHTYKKLLSKTENNEMLSKNN
jgi:NhaP-type Na+/H+ or K+/H+ antiporter